MEIANGLKYYDTGHLIYDVWLIIIILFLCTIISFLVTKAGNNEKITNWKYSDYVLLMISVGMVLAVVNVYSLLMKGVIVLVTILILYLTKQKKATYFTIVISSLVGFGLTIAPILLATSYVLFHRFKNKRQIK
ncbi:MAG: hypothetical protein JKY42_09215 [Flavobacteriales bacterium]|nr:hypothetical protein [Flavobacteriales bacterium]